MGKPTLVDKIRELYCGVIWRLCLRSVGMSDEQYWEAIYQQEKSARELLISGGGGYAKDATKN